MTIAIIPARGGSKGVPGKNLATIGGLPLVARAIKAAAAAHEIKRVYVSTDDEEIALVSAHYGASVISRPAKIADDFSSSESVLLHALAQIKKNTKRLPGQFAFMQCTSPFIRAADLDAAILQLRDGDADCVFAAALCSHFLWRTRVNGAAVAVGHIPAHGRIRRQARPPQFAEAGAFYIIKTRPFINTQNRFCGRCEIYPVNQVQALEIDDASDLLSARRIAADCAADFVLPTATRAIVSDFDGVLTDNRVLLSEEGLESAACNRSDGLALEKLCTRFLVLVLSAETNPIVTRRCKKLGISHIRGEKNKAVRLTRWLKEKKIDWQNTVYIGNDDNDIECLQKAALGVAPADSSPRALAAADVILPLRGGEGIMRVVLGAARI